MALWALLPAAYLIGSLPSAYLIGRLAGRDMRRLGSGNIGAMNSARNVGLVAGLVVLALDLGKGYLAVWGTWHLVGPWAAPAALLAAVAGHNWPVWLGFRGGKGLAAAAGGALYLCPAMILVFLSVLALTLLLTRYFTLAAVAGILAVPIGVALYCRAGYLGYAFGMAALLLIKHLPDLRRFWLGQERPLLKWNR